MQVMNGFGGGMIPNNFCVERFADVFLVARFLVGRFLVVRFLVAIFSPLNRNSGTAEIDSAKIPKRNRQVNKIRVEGDVLQRRDGAVARPQGGVYSATFAFSEMGVLRATALLQPNQKHGSVQACFLLFEVIDIRTAVEAADMFLHQLTYHA